MLFSFLQVCKKIPGIFFEVCKKGNVLSSIYTYVFCVEQMWNTSPMHHTMCVLDNIWLTCWNIEGISILHVMIYCRQRLLQSWCTDRVVGYLHIISNIQSVLIGSCHMHVDCGWVLKTSNEALSKFAISLQNGLTEELSPLTTYRHQAQSWRTNKISIF